MQGQQQGYEGFGGQEGSFSMQWSGQQREVGRANYNISGDLVEEVEGEMDGGFKLTHVDEWGEEGRAGYEKNAQARVQVQGREEDGVYREEGAAGFRGTGAREGELRGGATHQVYGQKAGENVSEAGVAAYARQEQGKYKDSAGAEYLVKAEVGPTGYQVDGGVRYQADTDDEDSAVEQWNYSLQGQEGNKTYSEQGEGVYQGREEGQAKIRGQGGFSETGRVKEGVLTVQGSGQLHEAGDGSATRNESLSMAATGMEGEEKWEAKVEANQQGSASAQVQRETKWGFQGATFYNFFS